MIHHKCNMCGDTHLVRRAVVEHLGSKWLCDTCADYISPLPVLNLDDMDIKSEDEKTLGEIKRFAEQEIKTIEGEYETDYRSGQKAAYNKILTIMAGEEPCPLLENYEKE